MPYTVPYSFDRFIENISLTGEHADVAERRKNRIISLLSNTFTILDAFPTGSIPKGTALNTTADLDVMVVLHWGNHIDGRTPEQVLQSVRDALGEYRTNVRKNGQAVTLYYKSWPNVDIVPVSVNYNANGSVNHYNVPDTNTGEWIWSRPRRHAQAVAVHDDNSGGAFRPLIRMIKQWNKAHSDLLESYHIEVLALQACSTYMIDYTWDVFQFFESAIPLLQAPLYYDDGYVDDYLDSDTRQDVIDRLITAQEHAGDAWYLTYDGRGRDREAIGLWRQIFGDKFPAYG